MRRASIEPNFFTDGRILRLSDTCALFFIGLLCQCDDEGYFSIDTLELSSRLSRWKSQGIYQVLLSLSNSGLIKISAASKVGIVTSWNYSRVGKRGHSKWKDIKIQWDDDKTKSIKAGNKETKGSTEKTIKLLPKKNITSETWAFYSEAYKFRYGALPVRNASVNGKLSHFVKRLGEDEAPLVAEFFITHNDMFYVKNMHSVGLLLKDAEKLRTEWITRRKITGTQAKAVEIFDLNASIINDYFKDQEKNDRS